MPATDLMDAAFLPAALIALAAGLLSFLSPCVLPIVPPYLAYIGGIGARDLTAQGDGAGGARSYAIQPALFFVLGLSTVFLLMGFAASAMGRMYLAGQDWFATGAGIVVMAFGAHFLGILRIPFLDREARFDAGDRGGTSFGAFVLGLAFAFGWTPCIGPQLGLILTLAAQDGTVGRGTGLLGIYALGLGVPFLLVAAFLPRLGRVMGFLKRNMERIELISGLLLWTVGLLMLTGGFSRMSYWLLETLPGLAALG